MPKDNFNEFLTDTGSNALISLIGAVVRLAFVKDGDWRVQYVTFFGGCAFGVLVGFLIKDSEFLSSYKDGIVAVSAILGKDVVNIARKKLPLWLPLLPLLFAGGAKAFSEGLREQEAKGKEEISNPEKSENDNA